MSHPEHLQVLVTGGARRVGARVVEALARAGHRVAIHCHRSVAEAEALAARVGQGARVITGDLASDEGPELVVARAWDALGGLDVVVNNASDFPTSRYDDVDFHSFVSAMRVNAWAPFAVARAFAKRRRSRADHAGPGHVINILDSRMVDRDVTHVAYHWAKRVLRDMTRELALEWGPDIRVNAIAPGAILAPVGAPESYMARAAEAAPLRRHGDPEDIARATLYLIQASFVTGDVMFVDGGRGLKGDVYG